MKLTQTTAIYAAPIPLRLLLAITFIWAGLGKFMHQVPVQGEKAALLANMGYDFSKATPAASDADPAVPDPVPMPAPTPEETAPEETAPAPEPDADTQTEPANQPDAQSPIPALLQTAQPQAAESPSEQPAAQTTTQPAAPTYTAADFPEPVKVRSLYNLAILTYNAAHPTPDEQGVTPPPIWPDWAARDAWPRYTAWAAAITEVAAGVLILVGLLTRLSAFSLATVMLSAIWLTEVGPAIQSGDALLGFLPNHDIWNIYAWRPVLWQFSLFGAAVALALAGPGALAIDRVAGSTDLDELDDDDE